MGVLPLLYKILELAGESITMPIEYSVLSAHAWLSGTIPLSSLCSQFQVEAKIHAKPCASSAGIHGNYDYVQRG